jgi:hypothetical protein
VNGERTIVQRSLATQLTFAFGKDSLSYTLKDLSGEIQFSPKYETIAIHQPYSYLVRDRPLRRVLYRVAIAVSLIPIALGLTRSPLTVPAIVGSLVIVAVLLFESSRGVRCTMLKMEPAPPGAGKLSIRVMTSKHHDEIISQIKAKWRDRLRLLHLGINRSNPIAQEVAKFKWLRENDVISDQEYDRVMREMQTETNHVSTRGPILN